MAATSGVKRGLSAEAQSTRGLDPEVRAPEAGIDGPRSPGGARVGTRAARAHTLCPRHKPCYLPRPVEVAPGSPRRNPTEGCPSGLRCQTRNLVCRKRHRGFESLLLRQLNFQHSHKTQEARRHDRARHQERCPSGLRCSIGNAVWRKSPGVRIPPSPPPRGAGFGPAPFMPRETFSSPTPPGPEGSNGNEDAGFRGTFIGSVLPGSGRSSVDPGRWRAWPVRREQPSRSLGPTPR